MSPPIESRIYENIKYVGKRPKNDQDNKCREKLSHIVMDMGCFYELCPEKLYLVYLAKDENVENFLDSVDAETSPFIFWSARDNPKLHYERFDQDFGPFNLAVTHHFCSRIKIWLDTQQFRNPDKHIAIVLDDQDTERKLNVTLLVAISAMVLLELTDEQVLQRLSFFMVHMKKNCRTQKQLIFREKKKFTDVSGNHSLMTVTLEDCIRAFYAALQRGFYEYYGFDHIEYLFYETVISGDLNWIVPGKLLAFAGPTDAMHPFGKSPEFYFHYFKDHNVTSIVRLNAPQYDSATFEKLGFEHHDLIFPDGFPPTSTIAAKFIKIVDEAKGAVAVHCFAGIGRTGTLIAAYLMARYNFTAHMAVAWTRICRPGSVIGEQQDWLLTSFNLSCRCIPMDVSPKSSPKARKNKVKDKGKSSQLKHENVDMHVEVDIHAPTTYADALRTYGQARALVMTKKQRESSAIERIRTRNHDKNNSKRLTDDRSIAISDDTAHESAKVTKITANEFVLNLGKTVPWSLYENDIFSLGSRENPVVYRIKDGRYEWKIKFPRSDYVELRHSYDTVSAHKEIGQNTMRSIMVDFMYEPEEPAASKTPNKKNKSKLTAADSLELDITVQPRLKPVVLYTLFTPL